jgi:hypothetical protein
MKMALFFSLQKTRLDGARRGKSWLKNTAQRPSL